MHDERHIKRLRELVTHWETDADATDTTSGGTMPPDLAGCAECRREWREWSRLFRLIDSDRRVTDTGAIDLKTRILLRMRETNSVSKRRMRSFQPVPQWRIWLEGLVRAPLAYGILGGLVLGVWIGSSTLESLTLSPDKNAQETDDLFFASASAWNTPVEAMSEDYFENLLDPVDNGGDVQ